jgi:gamma-glutamyltranspeptidase/glutathione hydrolase
MLIRFANGDGSHGYEQIDFRETMPAAGNETVRLRGKAAC